MSFEGDRRELERAIDVIRDGVAMGRRGTDVLISIDLVLDGRSVNALRALWSARFTLKDHEDHSRFLETWAQLARALLEGHGALERAHADIKKGADEAVFFRAHADMKRAEKAAVAVFEAPPTGTLMAYARLGRDSQVHIFSDGNQLHCMWCALSPTGESAIFTEYPLMFAHLAEHQAAGHKVPDYALQQLGREAAISPSVAEVSRLEEEGLAGPF